ncbi:hypothetical protein B0H14DRAFT_3489945 [Mycena olivaceomarginata]|nr:hypothetical protein B0H14DRAFT_3489945 [Mycena olivaceomarginata]
MPALDAASSMASLDAAPDTASSMASLNAASNTASSMAAVDAAPASDLQRGERYIQLDATLALYHWRCHLDEEEAVSKPPVNTFDIPYLCLCEPMLGILNMVRVNGDGLLEYDDEDDEMPPLEGEEIFNVVRSKL